MSRKKDKNPPVNQDSQELETLIYVGPTLRNGELQQYSIFQGELPEYVKGLIKFNENVKDLLVPIKDFAETNRKIKSQGTREYQIFRKLEGGNK